jgi:hypothetical protein
MYLATRRKPVLRKTSLSFAAVVLLVFSNLLYAQNSEPSACNMDSDGFCITGAVQDTPLSSPTRRNLQPVELNPVQNKLQVEFHNDLLRIDAENVTLGDTLKVVSARTGAVVQFPVGALGERIFVHLGPGAARDVVTQLLSGSHFNYVILSSASEPQGITRLILSRGVSTRESPTSDAPALLANDPQATQLYGSGFGEDSGAAAEPPQEPGPAAAPVAMHADGSKLSGEDLDRMQKLQIQQEQQQFAIQLQQQRAQQQQEQPSQNSPPQ